MPLLSAVIGAVTAGVFGTAVALLGHRRRQAEVAEQRKEERFRAIRSERRAAIVSFLQAAHALEQDGIQQYVLAQEAERNGPVPEDSKRLIGQLDGALAELRLVAAADIYSEALAHRKYLVRVQKEAAELCRYRDKDEVRRHSEELVDRLSRYLDVDNSRPVGGTA